MSTKITTSKGGTKPHANLLPFIALVLFGIIALVGVAAADSYYRGAPPVTKLSGVVNGSVDTIMSTDPWNTDANVTINRTAQNNWANLTLAVTPDLVDLKFARLYAVVYGGNMTATAGYPDYVYGNVSIKMNGENTTTGETFPISTLADNQLLNLDYNRTVGTAYNTSFSESTDPLVNLSRNTNDYILVFNVTDDIKTLNTSKIDVSMTTYNISGNFDARVKTVQLVYGWNCSDSDPDTYYWVNEGNDPMSTKGTPGVYNDTWFNTGTRQTYNATLWVDYIASKDGKYKWNNINFTPTVLNQCKYAGLNRKIWDQSNDEDLTIDENNNLSYTNVTGTSYKINFAVLKLI
jgi:hypothetical protein